MISGLYKAAHAMEAAEFRHQASAENLAQAHHPGYRRRLVRETSFESALGQQQNPTAATLPTGDGSGDVDVHVDFESGPLRQTGRSLDIAVQGDGFFVVDGPDGPLYTRNGGFHVNQAGQLVTIDQLPVLSEDGPLTLPNGVSSQAIQVSATGEVLADGQLLGQLQLASFEDNTLLTAAGVSLFAAPPGVQPQPSQVQVVQGFLEQSNVAAIDELVSIMVGSRQYEVARKAMSVIEQAIQKHVGVQ